jgi:hypothetical protein
LTTKAVGLRRRALIPKEILLWAECRPSVLELQGIFHCFRNDEGNKVTETIFTGSREFITLGDSGERISPSPEP